MKRLVFFLVCLMIITTGLAATDNSEQLLEELGIKMVNIPGKNFEMSSTEITQKTYKAVMGDNPSHFKGDDLPVEFVSWYDAISFCNTLSSKIGLSPVYIIDGKKVSQDTSLNGFRLPTSEDWRYAAKGGENYKYAGSDSLDEVAWHTGNSKYKTHPVAQKKPNSYGLYDMSGNVCEWCWDHEEKEAHRDICGGGWETLASRYCEVTGVYKDYGVNTKAYVGFRIVWNPSGKTIEEVKAEAERVAKEKAEAKATFLKDFSESDLFIAIPGTNFEMMRTEVTQKMYKAVMGDNPSHFKGDDLPVECISWEAAFDFCEVLNEQFGYSYPNEFRLPTTKEWWHAAMGKAWPFNDGSYAGSYNLDEIAWYSKNSDNKTHPVGIKQANKFGLYDMVGNVWEWCLDGDPYEGSNGPHRYLKGGSYDSDEYHCKTDNSHNLQMYYNNSKEWGFRVVREIK